MFRKYTSCLCFVYNSIFLSDYLNCSNCLQILFETQKARVFRMFDPFENIISLDLICNDTKQIPFAREIRINSKQHHIKPSHAIVPVFHK